MPPANVLPSMLQTRRLVHLLNLLVAVSALLVAIAAPFAWYHFGRASQAAQLQTAATVQASLLGELIQEYPGTWKSGTDAISDVFERTAIIGVPTDYRVLDDAGRVIFRFIDSLPSDDRLATPVLSASAPLFNSGRPVGSVEISRSLHGLRAETIRLAALASFLALLVFAFLRFVPLRALRLAVARSSYLASHDSLTELPNRLLFAERLKQALEHARRRNDPLAVLCLDLDRFKGVNDTLGHAAGNLLLQQTAKRLRGCLRDNDTLARLGGDEFAVVVGGRRTQALTAALAQRMIEAVAAPFDLGGHQAQVGLSIGIAVRSPSDPSDSDLLLSQADLALYRAKAEGRCVFRFYDDEMNARLQHRRTLERDLRRALSQQQFELHYQPQCDLATHRVLGVEALLRWQHPKYGRLAPMQFIPLAEESGLIEPISAWVLRTACRQGLNWPHLFVAVNLSGALFRQPGLEQLIAATLLDSGLPPVQLELEITEQVMLHHAELALPVLQRIRSLGVRIAMDDFGTGCSSFADLSRVPFDKINIAGACVRGAQDSDEAGAIVRAVIGLGHHLGMRISAKGVESAEQMRFLRAEGCEVVQGYYLGQPMPASAISRLLEATMPGDDGTGGTAANDDERRDAPGA